MRYFSRFLLIFALLFAQTGGLAHGISHVLADQSQDQSAPHDKLCDLCAAYAQIGSAIGSHAVSFDKIQQHDELNSLLFNKLKSNNAFSAYTARAPPCSA